MSETPPADSPPTSPPPPPERRTSNYLLLGVNLLILVLAIYVVWTRMKDGGGEDTADANANAATRVGNGDAVLDGSGGGSSLAPTRNRGGENVGGTTGAGPSMTERHLRGSLGANDTATGPGGGARLASDVEWTQKISYDEGTMRSLAGTERAIDKIGVQLEVYSAIHDGYPSSAVDFGANRGIEALYAALDDAGRLTDQIAGDTDGDGRPELLDGWGRPLVYVSPDDYDNPQEWIDGDGKSLTVAAARSRARDMFQAPSRFQLWSAGPDGTNDGGFRDDITSWVIRD